MSFFRCFIMKSINYIKQLQLKMKQIPSKMKNVEKSIQEIDIIMQIFEYVANINVINPLQNIIFFTCYAYIAYYTIINLLSPVKYYINLSHNLLKWILVMFLESLQKILNNIFKYTLLSKITIIILILLIVYPSKEAQKIHLKFMIRKKDQQYQQDKTQLLQTKISLLQKILISLATNFISFSDFLVKLIHPQNRTQIINSLDNITNTIQYQKYFWSIYQNNSIPNPNIRKIQKNELIQDRSKTLSINNIQKQNKLSQTMYLDKQKQSKDYLKQIQNAIKEGDSKIMKRNSSLVRPQKTSGLDLFKKTSLENVLECECDEVIPITKTKFSHFRQVIIRFYLKKFELEIIVKQNLKVDKYGVTQFKIVQDQNIIQFIFRQKSKFFEFKSKQQMQNFINPIIQKAT